MSTHNFTTEGIFLCLQLDVVMVPMHLTQYVALWRATTFSSLKLYVLLYLGSVFIIFSGFSSYMTNKVNVL